MEWQYNEKRTRIIVSPPKRTKKITGHRFSSVLGLNKYQTPFGAWCEITGLVKLPFEDNKFTIAGKTIEPKQIEYAKQKFPNIKSCEEYYGNSFPEYQYSNFKDLGRIFDGVRDFVSTKSDGISIVMDGECKTSSKPQDWANNQVPIDYLCQGMLYAYLDKLDRILYVASFLQPMDYNNPENYVVTEENTIFVVKKLKDCYIPMPHYVPSTSDEFKGDWTTQDIQYGGVQDAIDYCEDWWATYVETGISPEFDETLDKEYLDIIRKSKPSNDNELEDICSQAIALVKEIELLKVSSGINGKEKELKVLEKCIKEKMIETDLYSCNGYELKESKKEKFNEKRFAEEQEKLYNKYLEEEVTYRLTKKVEEE